MEILYNDSLKSFIDLINLDQEKKDFLIAQLPQMDLSERKTLLKKLLQAYFLDLNAKEIIKKIQIFSAGK
ncbi:MAG: hypothetical protein WC427_03070 [Candidatus Paceibacterota bacterium]|jgi:hypothetical protein